MYEHDRTEFAEENVQFLFKMIKNFDVFLSNNSNNLADAKLETIFKEEPEQSMSPSQKAESNKYDDYFS